MTTTKAKAWLMELDQDAIDQAAVWTARKLADTGVARVRLSPGDATEYRIMIASPDVEWRRSGETAGIYYWVALSNDFGAAYEWHGGQIDAGYAREKWTSRGITGGTRDWTAEVMARFLTAVSGARRGAEPSTTTVVTP